ncbi:MAG: hypothetical protein ACJAT2_003615 [Bacteriovoracaceae bacterium]|jgi:hypothetical protein
MKLYAQVTLDLPGATDTNRKLFYSILEKNKWTKVKNITTSWKIYFNTGYTPDSALEELKEDLDEAKSLSKLKFVSSMMIGFEPIKYAR